MFQQQRRQPPYFDNDYNNGGFSDGYPQFGPMLPPQGLYNDRFGGGFGGSNTVYNNIYNNNYGYNSNNGFFNNNNLLRRQQQQQSQQQQLLRQGKGNSSSSADSASAQQQREFAKFMKRLMRQRKLRKRQEERVKVFSEIVQQHLQVLQMYRAIPVPEPEQPASKAIAAAVKQKQQNQQQEEPGQQAEEESAGTIDSKYRIISGDDDNDDDEIVTKFTKQSFWHKEMLVQQAKYHQLIQLFEFLTVKLNDKVCNKTLNTLAKWQQVHCEMNLLDNAHIYKQLLVKLKRDAGELDFENDNVEVAAKLLLQVQ